MLRFFIKFCKIAKEKHKVSKKQIKMAKGNKSVSMDKYTRKQSSNKT